MATATDSGSHVQAPSRARGVMWVHPGELFTPFSDDVLSFGRGSDCGVVLDGPQVSRTHATIRRLGPLTVISDANSRNGTFLNGRVVREAPIALGDVIRLGDWIGVALELDDGVAAAGTYFTTPEEGLLLGPRSLEVWQRAEQIATSSTPVLIEGPTGTGKEVFARAIHRRSLRGGSFVAVNCAALPESLVEATLFGHTKGAFTGAQQASEGLISAAHRGTLLFDELVELPASQQAKLLRVLEESSVLRVGETTPRSVDVRFLAACQEPLWRLVDQGRFRADLLGRLAGCTVQLLPLRKRREEIPRLFLHAFQAAGGELKAVKPSAVEALCLADWPLNVRQLGHAARLAAKSIPGDAAVTRSTLMDVLSKVGQSAGAENAEVPSDDADNSDALVEARLGRRRMLWLKRHEHQLARLLEAMQQAGGNVSLAARSVGLSRSAATRLLEANTRRNGDSRPS